MAVRGLVATLLLLPLLAGCIGPDDPDDAGQLVNTSGMGNLTAPNGRTLVAFEETNRTEAGAGGVDHHHDYWQGKSRVLMFEQVGMMEPFPDAQNRALAIFRPKQGTFVYEGTASVEFTISNPERHACEPLVTFGGRYYCTDYLGEGTPAAPAIPDPSGGPSGLKLQYKHASTVQWIDAGEPKWDTPLVIQVRDPRETDMPHATSSVWEFQFVSPNAYDITLKFTVKVEIVRAEGEIPLWPGHPLFYTEDKPSRVVVDNVAAVSCDSGLGGTGCVLSAEPAPVVPSKLVSYGTRTLFIWVNVTKLTANNPATAPASWFLFHSNATGNTNITSPFDEVNYGIGKRELFWALPVDDGSMDSPYADGSRWKFSLGASMVTPENPSGYRISCYSGCAEWSAEYAITIIASSVELPADQYHMSCLDPDVHCPEPGETEETYEEDGRKYVVRAA